MDNRARLMKKDVPLRLRSAAIDALRLSGEVKLCVDPAKTSDKQVAFFVRTPKGKPDRSNSGIKSILEKAVALRHEGKVEAGNSTLSLASEKSPSKKAADTKGDQEESGAPEAKKETAKSKK